MWNRSRAKVTAPGAPAKYSGSGSGSSSETLIVGLDTIWIRFKLSWTLITDIMFPVFTFLETYETVNLF